MRKIQLRSALHAVRRQTSPDAGMRMVDVCTNRNRINPFSRRFFFLTTLAKELPTDNSLCSSGRQSRYNLSLSSTSSHRDLYSNSISRKWSRDF